MHSDLVELGWTEEQWNRIGNTVAEEAQRARIAAQVLPVVGPEDPSTVAVPSFGLSARANPYKYPVGKTEQPAKRLTVNSDPDLYLTTISVNVQLRMREVADADLNAAMAMFRRAANYIARIEDALVLNGRAADAKPAGVTIEDVFTVSGDHDVKGLVSAADAKPAWSKPAGTSDGQALFNQIVEGIGTLEASGHFGPFGCILSQKLFNVICSPEPKSLVLPRDRILPFLNGPLLRSSAVPGDKGVLVALGGNPVELIVAGDISVRYLQTTLEPRVVFRVSERVALRIKEATAIALLG